jgi:hypothetical protein
MRGQGPLTLGFDGKYIDTSLTKNINIVEKFKSLLL